MPAATIHRGQAFLAVGPIVGSAGRWRLDLHDRWSRRHHQNRLRTGFLNRGDETVTPPGQGFYVAGLSGGVAEHLAEPVHRRVQSVIEIDERTAFPKLLLELVPGDDLTGLPDERRQDLQRLSLQAHSNTVLAQFAGKQVEGETAKCELLRRIRPSLTTHGTQFDQA